MSDFDGDIKMYMPKGSSMLPFLRSNSVIIVKKVSEHFLNIGDVIVFSGSQNTQKLSHYIVHRLIRKIKTADGKNLFQAKGDANYSFDNPVYYEDIIGKVYLIEKINKSGAKKLRNLDSWFWKKLNYLLAKTSWSNRFKLMVYSVARYVYHRMRFLKGSVR